MTTDTETIRLVRHSEELVRHSEETAAQARVILDIATTLRDRLPEPRPEAVATETYQVGDPDTTPDSRPWCGAVSDPGDACTREPGHAGPHAEGDGGRIIAVWDDDPEPTYRVGDPYESPSDEQQCAEVYDGWTCSLPLGHAGQHAAGDGQHIVAAWDDGPSPMTQAEWDALPVGTLVEVCRPQAIIPATRTVLRTPTDLASGPHSESPYSLAGGLYWSALYTGATDIRVLYRPEDPS